MGSIVIALPKIEDAKKIRTILVKHGFSVAGICNTGSNALANISELGEGVLICSGRLLDMNYQELMEYMPEEFQLLLLGSRPVIQDAPSWVLTVEIPLRVSDLINTVHMILTQKESRRKKRKKKPKPRSEKEQNYISNAKMMLMQRNHLSEEEAFRYIQKCSMDSGTNMVETAQMLLRLFYEEI